MSIFNQSFANQSSQWAIIKPKPVNMRLFLRLLVIPAILFSLLFSACRNEPKLPNKPWDKTVKVRLPSGPKVLHFLEATDSESRQILYQIFMPLVNFDPETYEMTPVLIKSLPKITEFTEGINAGLVKYDYEIRKEATWANDSPVTGNDYLFTIKAMYIPNKRSPFASQFNDIKRIEIDRENPKKFSIYSKPYMMGLAGYSDFCPLPAYLYDPNGILQKYSFDNLKDKEKSQNEADLLTLGETMYSQEYISSPKILQGSGPYQLSEWITGQQLTLTKRKNWWGEKVKESNRMLKAIPEKIIYKIIPDANAAISLMNNEELDIMAKMNWTTFLNQKEKVTFSQKFNFYTPDLFGIRMMYFNTANEKLIDKNVRRAIAHLLDRKEVFNTVFYGYPVATDLPVGSNMPTYNKNLSPIDFNVEKAKQLLKEAGWKDSNNNGIVDKKINGELTELDIELSYAIANEDYPAVATIFKSHAQNAGVNLVLKGIEGRTFANHVKSRNYEMAFLGIGGYHFNVDPEFRWSSQGAGNYSSFGTSESDVLIKKIKKTIDINEQNQLFRQLNAIIYEEQPCLFICTDKDRIIANNKFGNLATHGISPGFNINELNGNATIPVQNKN